MINNKVVLIDFWLRAVVLVDKNGVIPAINPSKKEVESIPEKFSNHD